jgi:thiamine-monophosphate kinase
VAGDAVAVSSTPGAAATGLRLLEQRLNGPMAAEAIAAWRRPHARIELGLAAVNLGIHCAIDTSDGLVQDIGHIAQRSTVGIELDLEALPLAPSAIAFFGSDAARELAVAGGEDYQLVLVGRQAALETLEGVTVIGRVLDQHPGEVIVRHSDGAPYVVPSGWDQLQAWPLRRSTAQRSVPE